MLMADLGNWIGLAILVFTVLGWIVNAIKGNDANGNPLPKARPKPNRDLRSEIEVFLDELNRNQPGAAPKVERAERLERIDPPRPAVHTKANVSRREEPLRDGKGQKSRGSAQNRTSTSGKNSRKGGAIDSQKSRPQQSLEQHVSQFIEDSRVHTAGSRQLGSGIARSVEQHLSGGTVAAVSTVQPHSTEPHPISKMLRSRQGVLQAMVLNEVLQRPLALRQRRQ